MQHRAAFASICTGTATDRPGAAACQWAGPGLVEADISAFTDFTTAVLERVMSGLVRKNKGGQKPARRLEAAATHVLRAAHRTHGPTSHYDIAAYELNEVLLHYVIAMEALLADESDHLELSRKVQYRVATMFATDDERLTASKLVKEAYNTRSKYVHGDQVTAFDLDALRRSPPGPAALADSRRGQRTRRTSGRRPDHPIPTRSGDALAGGKSRRRPAAAGRVLRRNPDQREATT